MTTADQTNDYDAQVARHRAIIMEGQSGKHPEHVHHFRQAWHAAGFVPLALLTGSKRCVDDGWQNEHLKNPPGAVAAPPDPAKMSTGILCHGLRAVDIDFNDPVAAFTIEKLAEKHLGETVRRGRRDSPRCALLYRAAKGAPGKTSLKGQHGQIEVLGSGQQIVVDGLHPDSGLPYVLSKLPDYDFRLSDLPAVTESQIEAFLAAAGPLIGADIAASSDGKSSAKKQADSGPFDTLPPPLKLQFVQAAFVAIDNSIVDERDRWRNLIWAACDAEDRGCDGAIDAAREWARRGIGYDGEAADSNFMSAVEGFDRGRGIGVGTLIRTARQAGGGAALDAILAQSKFAAVPASQPAPDGAGYAPRYQLVGDIQPDTAPQLWDGIIRRGTTCVIWAPPYTGKTILAAALAFAVEQGRACMGHDCERAGVYFVESEGTELLADNLRAIYRENAVDITTAAIGISGEYLNLTDPASVAGTIRDIEHFATRAGGCGLIIIDTLSQSIAGKDENTQAVMSEAVKAVALMGQRVGAATLILHHTGKDEQAGPRGSSVLGANVHATAELTDQKNGLIKIEFKKFKGGRPAMPEYFRVEELTLRMDHKGRPVGAGIAIHVPASDAKAVGQHASLSAPQRAAMTALAGVWPGSEITKAEFQTRFNLHYTSSSEKPNTRNKALSRAINDLAAKNLICLRGDGDLFCLAYQPARIREATRIFDSAP